MEYTPSLSAGICWEGCKLSCWLLWQLGVFYLHGCPRSRHPVDRVGVGGTE